MSRTHALVTAIWRDDSQVVEVPERPLSEPTRAEGKLRVGRGSGLTTTGIQAHASSAGAGAAEGRGLKEPR